ncbi:type II toxin-antitoxin system Phd/YefM family antitoxin [Clostridiaceae bacterium HSG29]|nr:type II toxin-antitoxin system Phd/YefM family antitoxin [Clostridiaceae bacterium HSG29]
MIIQFEQMLLPITEFRNKMTKVLDELIAPRILMNRDKPKAVLVPYELFKSMELALEDQMDEILVKIAEKRLSDSESKYKSHEEFWSDMDIE